jgi:hypothetical protein
MAGLRLVVRIALFTGLLLAMASWALTLLTSAFPGNWVGVLSAAQPLLGLAVFGWLGWRLGRQSGSAVWGALAGVLAGAFFALLTAVPELYVIAPTRILLSGGAKLTAVLLSVLLTALFAGVVGLVGGSLGAGQRGRRMVDSDPIADPGKEG